jgi:hypothetical protein
VEILGGDVGDVLADLRSSNLSGRFDSWVRDGDNDRVTADEISDALGKTHLAVIAEQTGLSERQAVERIAEELPGLIDEATPGGARRLGLHHPFRGLPAGLPWRRGQRIGRAQEHRRRVKSVVGSVLGVA